MHRLVKTAIALSLAVGSGMSLGSPASFAQSVQTSSARPPGVYGAGGIWHVEVHKDTPDRTTVGLPSGNPAHIEFPEDFSAGYSWSLSKTDARGAQLTLVGVTHKGGWCDFEVATSGTGSVTLELVYGRQQEAPAKTFTITINLD